MPVDESGKKKSVPHGLWTKCPKCEQIIYNKELEKNLKVCSKCGTPLRTTARERVAQLVDEGTFQEIAPDLSGVDPLGFVDTASYAQRLKESKKKTGEREAILAGVAQMNGQPVALAVLDFGFMGGSMGSVVGEKVTLAIERGLKDQLPVIVVSASGGARMQEGILSLFQMAKTSAALARLEKARLPFISVVTDPTTGGVTASFAMLGDVIVAEPKALVAFAGPRVIEQTIRQTLPQGFQQSEFLLKHGMVDVVVDRAHLKSRLAELAAFFMAARKAATAAAV
ncbi:MAG TPA: acetyl-CoA carboxylase, carboxyltransferase subunit beta [Elusimicrobiota bacterium]|jgi:acetyl-CoA carboxylase carboxyl transferase subunit beta|nr:acetyl-CoA carboxylase, carboxyltransferase subunit beta [Elusimicrobiota bacterium]HMZ26342.1 acetyl-CoA carboxylase, carboxyltransferase subunit beta [Elusimicrobiota bacterium]HNA60938.1 acetyl-CoA carboxylase, carboxyltransferase subunit beta [Elusimicrobiota bacterium]HNF58066.1 acetyl-CoA carboxylase, carboxyltransferase subunit beta [Elusimicrobiota bacterium]HNG44295.1 acetyl-CoA carboxylase, carboxyltransferase subunit beta [Elusimicrobiota bacterium]